MTELSNYDKLYEKYWASDLRKSGTRYERLTAFIFKAIHDSDTVIHDIKLVGESDVKHQIDVTIQEKSGSKRILLECKDFDISGKKVGLGIVRDFWGVIDDIHPDEAMIITCNDFTSEAMKYAKNKNIKLAVLREFQESDWEGRCKEIAFTLKIRNVAEPKVSMNLSNQDAVDKLSKDLSDAKMDGVGIRKGQPVYLNLSGERIQFNDYIDRLINNYPRNEPGPVKLPIDLNGSTIEVENRGGIPIRGIVVEFEIIHNEDYFEITSDKVAKLIFTDLSGSDIVIFEEDIIHMKINEETGEVIDSKSPNS